MKLTHEKKDFLTLADGRRLELAHRPDLVVMPIVKERGDTISVGYLTHDPDCDDPCISDDYFGFIYEARRHGPTLRDYEKALGLGDFDGEPEDPYAVILDVYEHGQVQYRVSGGAAQCQFDTAKGGAVFVPSEELRKELDEIGETEAAWKRCLEHATGAARDYTDWRNGNCYTVVVLTYDNEGKFLSEESCGGYIGSEHAFNVLKSEYLPEEQQHGS